MDSHFIIEGDLNGIFPKRGPNPKKLEPEVFAISVVRGSWLLLYLPLSFVQNVMIVGAAQFSTRHTSM